MGRLVKDIAFDFDTDEEGWMATHDLSPFEIRDGCLVTTARGGDPYMVRPTCRIAPDTVKTIVIRMSVSAGPGAQFFWITESSPQFAEDKSLRFRVTPDGQFHEYRLNVGPHALWQGQTIKGIRLDPTGAVLGAEIAVDYIRGE